MMIPRRNGYLAPLPGRGRAGAGPGPGEPGHLKRLMGEADRLASGSPENRDAAHRTGTVGSDQRTSPGGGSWADTGAHTPTPSVAQPAALTRRCQRWDFLPSRGCSSWEARQQHCRLASAQRQCCWARSCPRCSTEAHGGHLPGHRPALRGGVGSAPDLRAPERKGEPRCSEAHSPGSVCSGQPKGGCALSCYASRLN